MFPARLHDAAALVASSLLVVLTAAPGADGACNATCRRDLARCMATQCGARVGREACRRRCKPAAIRTLAYVLSECREDAVGFSVGQALRIRRGDREPITVAEFPPSKPKPDRRGLCQFLASRGGAASVAAGALQRLGVSPDGSGVVFEVNDEFSIVGSRLSPEQKGFFFVRSDGRGLRHLPGPASQEPTFRIIGVPPGMMMSWLATSVAFSPNGRRVAFEDHGPGLGGQDAVQIFVLDLATGQRTQVTHLPSGKVTVLYPDSCCPQFIDNETVLFRTVLNLDGSNPEHDLTAVRVRIDGSGFKPIPRPVGPPGSRIVSTFEVAGLGTNLVTLTISEISEVFLQDGKNLLQLTNFRRVDTTAAFLGVTRTRAFFLASANPFHRMNPYGNCQIFSVNTLGTGLRQVTHFNPGSPAGGAGCVFGGCGVGAVGVFQDPMTKAVVFDSTCDPFHVHPFGGQIFAMRPDGLGLRQLTDASGFTTNPDGSIRVELPGPFAYSTMLR